MLIFLKKLPQQYLATYLGFSIATWINVITVFLIAFGTMITAIFTLFLNKQGISVHDIALILAVGGVGAIVGSYFSGFICSHISPNFIVQSSLVCFAFNMFAFTLFSGLHAFLILFFCSNFFYGIFRPANLLVLFSHAKPEDYTRVVALNRVAFNLGFAFGTMIGGILADINFNLFFVFTGTMSLLGSLLFVLFRPWLRTSAYSKKDKMESPQKIPLFPLSRRFLMLGVLFLFYNIIFFQIRSTFDLFVVEHYQQTVRFIGFLFTINFLLIVFFEVPAMVWLKRMNQLALVRWGVLLTGLGLAILPFSAHYAWAIVSTVTWTIGEILCTSPFYVLANQYAAEHHRAFYTGAFQSVNSLAMVLAPLFGGYLYVFYRGYLLWWVCGMISLLALVGFRWLKKAA